MDRVFAGCERCSAVHPVLPSALGSPCPACARGALSPAELDPALLSSRLRPVWWPHWLVDARVEGRWEAEAGYDYEVQSAQEMYEGGRWSTHEVTETRCWSWPACGWCWP
jgi:hypothetical protein